MRKLVFTWFLALACGFAHGQSRHQPNGKWLQGRVGIHNVSVHPDFSFDKINFGVSAGLAYGNHLFSLDASALNGEVEYGYYLDEDVYLNKYQSIGINLLYGGFIQLKNVIVRLQAGPGYMYSNELETRYIGFSGDTSQSDYNNSSFTIKGALGFDFYITPKHSICLDVAYTHLPIDYPVYSPMISFELGFKYGLMKMKKWKKS